MSAYHDRRELLRCASSLAEGIASSHMNPTAKSDQLGVRSSEQSGQVAFWMHPKGGLERSVLHALKSRIATSEVNFPGSGEICSLVCALSIQDWIKREMSGESQEEIRREMVGAAEAVEAYRWRKRRVAVEDMRSMLGRVPVSVRGELERTVSESALGSMISVRRSKSAESSVRVSTGCRIQVSNIPSLVCSREVVDPRIALIDGTIDTVGQIHRILDDSCNRGTQYVIGCRGASEEVVRTVSVNCSRGTVRVILFLSRLDDLTVGAIDDFAACTGSWVIRAQGGESLTTAFDRLTNARGKFWIEEGKIRMKGDPSPDLDAHIERLRADAASGDQSVRDFLTSRIIGLSSSRIEVFLGETDARSHPAAMESVDSDVRSLASSLVKGLSVEEDPPIRISSRIRSILTKTAAVRPMCAGSLEAGWASGLRAAVELCTVGCAVII